jgi:hypothetical protein
MVHASNSRRAAIQIIGGIGEGMQVRPDVLRALMRDSESDGRCACPGRERRIYYSHDGFPDGEIPPDRCEDCGGTVTHFCVNFVSNWGESRR